MASKLLKNSMIYALGDIIPKVISFIIFPILTKFLTTSDYGILNYVNTVNVVATVVGFMCLNTYYLVHYYRLESELDKQKLLGNLTIFILCANLILSLIFYSTGWYYPSILSHKINFFPYFAISLATNFFNIFSILPSALFRVQERPWPLTLINILKSVLTSIFVLYLVIYLKYNVLGVLWGNLAISILFSIIYIWILFKNVIWNININQIKEALFFSLPLLPGALAYYFVSMSDRIFIVEYLDLDKLGIFSTAATLALILNVVTYGVYKAFEPYLFKIYGTSNFNHHFFIIRDIYIFIILLGAMLISLFAREFFIIFSSEGFHQAYYYVPIIQLGVVFSSITILYSTVISASSRTRLNSIISIISGLVSVFINLILIPRFGIIIPCLSFSISLGCGMGMSIYFSRLERNYIRPILAILIVFVTIFITIYIIKIENVFICIIFKIIVSIFSVISMSIILKFKPDMILKLIK